MKIDLPRLIFEKPTVESIAAMGYKKKLPARLALELATRIYLRTVCGESQNWKCCWCGQDTDINSGQKNSITLEHVTPKSEGGKDEWENSAMACYACNHKRGTQSIEAFIASGFKPQGKGQAARTREAANDRRAYARAKKFEAMGWKKWQEHSETWMIIDVREWVNSRIMSETASTEIIKLYG